LRFDRADQAHDDANTPLDEEEHDGMIPTHSTTRAELNQWESLNIANAHDWLSGRRPPDVLSVDFLQTLHRQMFGETWSWAGTFRRSEKNVSPYPWTNVPMLVHELVQNTRAQYEASDKSSASLDEIATRFHHELVRIHPWPNGNGRHARLATDLLLAQWGRPSFTWGSEADLTKEGEARASYTRALRSADGGNLQPLREFVRS
jgi:Fic-DOC domain mobile mystery protein B